MPWPANKNASVTCDHPCDAANDTMYTKLPRLALVQCPALAFLLLLYILNIHLCGGTSPCQCRFSASPASRPGRRRRSRRSSLAAAPWLESVDPRHSEDGGSRWGSQMSGRDEVPCWECTGPVCLGSYPSRREPAGSTCPATGLGLQTRDEPSSAAGCGLRLWVPVAPDDPHYSHTTGRAVPPSTAAWLPRAVAAGRWVALAELLPARVSIAAQETAPLSL